MAEYPLKFDLTDRSINPDTLVVVVVPSSFPSYDTLTICNNTGRFTTGNFTQWVHDFRQRKTKTG